MSTHAKLKRNLATVKEVLAANPYLTHGWLRHQLFNRHENGLDRCVFPIGRKLLIDVDLFQEWMEQGCGKADPPRRDYGCVGQFKQSLPLF